MSEEIVKCMQCNNIPDQYASLDCQHCFCIACMALNFLRGGHIFQKPEATSIMYICSLCEKETELKEECVSMIDITIHQFLLPQLQSNLAQPKVIHEDSQENDPQNDVGDEPSHIQEVTNPLDSIYAQTPSKTDFQEHNNQCEKHNLEDMNMFCFTCETKCFCVKCLVQHTQHKSHDVQNVQNSMGKLKSKMTEANHTIQAGIELMNLQKKRIADQSAQNLQQIEDFQRLYQCSFEMLVKMIRNKEKELTQQMTQLASIQNQQASNLISDINIKINTLENLKNDFEKISNQKSYHMQCSSLLFNYYSDCKQMMQKVVGQINFGELVYTSEASNIKYFPDYKEQFFNVQEFDDRILQIKEKIEHLTDKTSKQESSSQLFRSFSLHEKNWIQPTTTSSVSKRCTTQADEDYKFKSQVSLRVTGQLSGKTPDSSMHYQIENSFQKKKPQTTQKSLLDDFKSLYSDRLSSNKNEDKQRSQYSINVKRSISELSPKQQISPYFKLNQRNKHNPLNVLRQQQGQFYKSRLMTEQK